LTFKSNTPTTWRGDPDEVARQVCYDRIVFFADGDFQPSFETALSGNLARLFYGQMLGSPAAAAGGEVAPPRAILSRRIKIETAQGGWPDPHLGNWPPPGWANDFYGQSYNAYPWERASVALWKNEPYPWFHDLYFRPAQNGSMFKRSRYDQIALLKNPATYLQPIYLLPDVTDFQIQIWIWDGLQWRWFPQPQERHINSNPVLVLRTFGYYWNAPPNPAARTLFWQVGNDLGDMVQWYPEAATGLKVIGMPNGVGWPGAIKFTFTLHDAKRARFAQGQTFEYVVRLPPR